MYVAIRTVPGIESSPWTALVATWVSAFVGTLISWATTAGTDDGLVTSLTRRAARRSQEVPDPDVDGILFVQLDGLPFPVLRWAIAAGLGADHAALAVLGGPRAPASGRPSCPAPRRPASSASCTAPSTASRPSAGTTASSGGCSSPTGRPTPPIIEERASDGRGLLADGGVSVSNLFTGDAERSFLTMSRVELERSDVGTATGLRGGSSPIPEGFVRAFVRTIAEIVKERFQARRQVRARPDAAGPPRLDLRRAPGRHQRACCATSTPRSSPRRCARAPAASTSTTSTTTRSPTTPGSSGPSRWRPSTGSTASCATLERLAESGAAALPLRVVSDHGQSQGQVFADRYGVDLADAVRHA